MKNLKSGLVEQYSLKVFDAFLAWAYGSSSREAQTAAASTKYVQIDRAQGMFTTLRVDELIVPEHPARLIWNLVGQMDLTVFEKDISSREGGAGRSCWMPHLLISVSIYGYTRGIASARQSERLVEWEPGLRWLCGMESIKRHTLSDFRLQERERLQELLTKILALWAAEGQVNFAVLLQDGTNIRTQAGRQSFRRQATLQKHLEEAQACVAELDRHAAAADAVETDGQNRTKQEAALERAARERLARMKAAIEELERRQALAKDGKQVEVRASQSEAESRKMKATVTRRGGFRANSDSADTASSNRRWWIGKPGERGTVGGAADRIGRAVEDG